MGFEQAQPLLPAALFRTSKPDGLGIGLALSHATVERLGGALSMQATEGRGVQVEFWLPRCARMKSPDNVSSLTGLLVDDDPLYLETPCSARWQDAVCGLPLPEISRKRWPRRAQTLRTSR